MVDWLAMVAMALCERKMEPIELFAVVIINIPLFITSFLEKDTVCDTILACQWVQYLIVHNNAIIVRKGFRNGKVRVLRENHHLRS